MRVRVEKMGVGLHPSELFVSINTKDGKEAVTVDPRSLQNGSDNGTSIEIGWPVAEDNGYYLIELPRPSANGTWRVWVETDDVIDDEQLERATG